MAMKWYAEDFGTFYTYANYDSDGFLLSVNDTTDVTDSKKISFKGAKIPSDGEDIPIDAQEGLGYPGSVIIGDIFAIQTSSDSLSSITGSFVADDTRDGGNS